MPRPSQLPTESVLQKELDQFDYLDAFEESFKTDTPITSSQLGILFFTTAPAWVEKLFIIRNTIVSLVGLKTSGNSDKEKLLREFRCEPGQRLGLFKVFSKTENEVVMGEDDVHLNFRISLFISLESNQHVTITTLVKRNNRFGRLYFYLIKPFHRLIVPVMLKNLVRDVQRRRKDSQAL
ncbi:MAG: DUF2867 domain-containing protein [Cytophagaceae bacterium]|jgi:hypothetical protein|nr:DUF2867 domain-containing protein [Cytophagaceae bacterium]